MEERRALGIFALGRAMHHSEQGNYEFSVKTALRVPLSRGSTQPSNWGLADRDASHLQNEVMFLIFLPRTYPPRRFTSILHGIPARRHLWGPELCTCWKRGQGSGLQEELCGFEGETPHAGAVWKMKNPTETLPSHVPLNSAWQFWGTPLRNAANILIWQIHHKNK